MAQTPDEAWDDRERGRKGDVPETSPKWDVTGLCVCGYFDMFSVYILYVRVCEAGGGGDCCVPIVTLGTEGR